MRKPTVDWILDHMTADEEGGPLYIKFGEDLEELPENLTIEGTLWLQNCKSLKALPKGLNAYEICIENCPEFETVPSDIRFFDQLEIIECPKLVMIPAVNAMGDIVVKDCVSFKGFEDGLSVYGLEIEDCPAFNKLPPNLSIGALYLSDCPSIEYFPQTITVRDHISIERCGRLKSLLFPMFVSMSITVKSCKRLEHIFGSKMFSGETIEIKDCPSLVWIPYKVVSGSDVTIVGCPLSEVGNVVDVVSGGNCEIDFRARKLLVGKNLFLPEGFGIEMIPDKTTVGGEILIGKKTATAKTTKLKEARKAAKLTQAELAARLDVPQQYVSRWENGVMPSPDMISKIFVVLGVDISE